MALSLYALAYKDLSTESYMKIMENLPGLDQAIAETVKKIRAKTGLTQEQFADFARLSRVYIAQLETGERGASLNALISIAQAVGMTGAELVAQIEAAMPKSSKLQKQP